MFQKKTRRRFKRLSKANVSNISNNFTHSKFMGNKVSFIVKWNLKGKNRAIDFGFFHVGILCLPIRFPKRCAKKNRIIWAWYGTWLDWTYTSNSPELAVHRLTLGSHRLNELWALFVDYHWPPIWMMFHWYKPIHKQLATRQLRRYAFYFFSIWLIWNWQSVLFA